MIARKLPTIALYLIMFLIGFIAAILVFYAIPAITDLNNEVEAPGDWIQTSDLRLTQNSLIINVPNITLSSYAPSGSMKPVFDQGANGIRVVPSDPSQIEIGDIITFSDKKIVHRVVDKGVDSQGSWYITKGDNNDSNDRKVRFNEIKYVTIGVLY